MKYFDWNLEDGV